MQEKEFSQDAGPYPLPDAMPTHTLASHIVQFYEDEEFLTNRVGDFGAEALHAGRSLVIIATPAHSGAYLRSLVERGLDTHELRRRGRLTTRDAHEMLSRFMVDGLPDKHRLVSCLRPTFEKSHLASADGSVCAFGEMVDLLWRDGNIDAALRLEELWNEVSDEFLFSLLCAHDLSTFGSSTHSDAFRAICSRHTHVRPSERYPQHDEKAQLLEISLLQQRARSLDTEIEGRKELEQRLKDAAAEQLALLERERGARSEAEVANRAKNDFLAIMSHELRTPLNAIGGHAQLLEMGLHGPISEAQRVALTRIVNNQQHLLSLINHVFDLSRVERGRIEILPADLPLAALVGEVAATLAPALATGGLHFELLTDDEALVVRAGHAEVAQILVSVLHNAIKFTPAGGSIIVSVRRDPAREGDAEIRISDTGAGIERAKLPTFFEAFALLDRRRTTRHEGIGLGLTISRDLARAMGGELSAESELGDGTTFVLRLPLA